MGERLRVPEKYGCGGRRHKFEQLFWVLQIHVSPFINPNNGSPCCPHRRPCPRLRVIPEAVPQSSRADCTVTSEGPDVERCLETSRYLRWEDNQEVSLQCTHRQSKIGSNGTDVVPLLTVGVGAAMTGGTTPSKPDNVKGKKKTNFDPAVVLRQRTSGHLCLPVVARRGGQLRYVGQSFSGVVSEFRQILTCRG